MPAKHIRHNATDVHRFPSFGDKPACPTSMTTIKQLRSSRAIIVSHLYQYQKPPPPLPQLAHADLYHPTRAPNMIRRIKFQRKILSIVPSQDLYIRSRTHLSPPFREQSHPNQTTPLSPSQIRFPENHNAKYAYHASRFANAAQMLHPANGHDRALHSYFVPTMHICVNDQASRPAVNRWERYRVPFHELQILQMCIMLLSYFRDLPWSLTMRRG
ncbi:hypothetical protein BKA63DRAFT_509078 [Paraphoma chrysanthemicola]|nr:hypothetical protein BKA63DRAFT_509078 [Paraphoma chrysanthemicola]